MTALVSDIRELSFDEIGFVSGGADKKPATPKKDSDGDNSSLADTIRDIADFVRGFIDGLMD